ncbi:hypothetical protein BH11PSE2_BH11PSE2_21860 [soil metagenome]
MPHSLVARLALAFMLFVCGMALWRGRWPERTVALTYLAQEALYLALYDPTDRINPQWEEFFMDVIVLGIVAYVAVKSNRNWVKYITALQMLAVANHLALAIDLRIDTYVSFMMGAIGSIADLLLLLFGTVQVMLWDQRDRGSVKVGAQG